MILNTSKIKTEALLLFCRDLIGTYKNTDDSIIQIDESTKKFINDSIDHFLIGINSCVHKEQYYLDNFSNTRIKYILKSYNYINDNIAKHLEKGDTFNPAMLCFSLLITWFFELKHENNSKEFIFFTLYPYGDIYDKMLVNISNDSFMRLNISMIKIAEDVVGKLHYYKIK